MNLSKKFDILLRPITEKLNIGLACGNETVPSMGCKNVCSRCHVSLCLKSKE